jgi:hypothetical protein
MAASGLYSYGYRFYDPLTQRWLNRDPIQEHGGINLYAAFEGDPINNRDLWGQSLDYLPPSNVPWIEYALPNWPNYTPPADSQYPLQDFAKKCSEGIASIGLDLCSRNSECLLSDFGQNKYGRALLESAINSGVESGLKGSPVLSLKFPVRRAKLKLGFGQDSCNLEINIPLSK